MAADAERNMQLGSGKDRVVDRHDPVRITSVFVLHVGGTRVVSLGVLSEVFIYTSNCFHLFRWCLTDMTTTIHVRLFFNVRLSRGALSLFSGELWLVGIGLSYFVVGNVLVRPVSVPIVLYNVH